MNFKSLLFIIFFLISTLNINAKGLTTSTSDYISAWCYHDAGNDRLWQGGESSFSGFRLS